MPGRGIAKLISASLVRHVIASHIGLNPETQAKMIAGDITCEMVPQGKLIERIRAGGILSPTGLGKDAEIGKQIVKVEGRRCLCETPLTADFALIGAWQTDYIGNLCFMLTLQNFNPVSALVGRVVIAEAESIVPVGVIPPDAVRTPGVLVDHLLIRAS